MPRPLSGPSGRRARATLAVFLAALAVALGMRALRSRRALSASPTGAAEWIWAPLGRTVEPLAFYAARDFDLAAPPPSARLVAAADEEYVLYLNGRRVGSGGAAAGARPTLDAYEVAPLLRRGGNRWVAELRSGRGAGGFLARLTDGAGNTLAATDAGWRIVRRYRPGLVRGWLPLAGPAATEREAAATWSRPPAGRWGMPAAAPPRPLFAGGRLPVAVDRAATVATLARGIVRLDLGREIEGYLALEVAPRARRQVGLIYLDRGTGTFGSAGSAGPAGPAGSVASFGRIEPGAPSLPVIVAPGAPVWLDVRPRRLRSLAIAGDLEVTGARVYPAAAPPTAVPRAGQISAELPGQGLLGLSPPPLRTPVEDEVWRELERLAGVAGREHL